MASLPSDLTCPTGTVRLADASKKTLETCMPDTDTPGGGQTPGGGGQALIDTDGDGTPDFTDVDDDGDGLIEINSLVMLHNIRHNVNGDSYKTGAGAGDATGCGKTGSVLCDGYELTQDLSFDKGGYEGTWRGDSSSGYTLDSEDSVSPYFIVDGVGDDGWLPIDSFNAIFEGNGHSITGLAISRNLSSIGMFGSTTTNAAIRNLGLIKNLANCTRTSGSSRMGGLVGHQSGGSITASYATGAAVGRAGDDDVGGLVGRQSDGSITASYATGAVVGGAGDDNVGGLVGEFNGEGSITASYARGAVHGGTGSNSAGGLVGFKAHSTAKIIASYATGDVGVDSSLIVGRLVSFLSGGSGMVIDSYGFGMVSGGVINTAGDASTYPAGVTSAMQLISTNVPSSWNNNAQNTKGAWDLGTNMQTPALKYADYDGAGNKYYCDNVDAPTPTTGTPPPIPIPNCGEFIPNQERSP